MVYDRKDSALALVNATEFDWGTLLKDVGMFYFSGITPAISLETEKAVMAACEYCVEHDIPVA